MFELRHKTVSAMILGAALLLGATPSAAAENGPAPATPTFAYPPSRRSDHVDVYHGVAVPDPYRWLEEPDSPETRSWIHAQNQLTYSYLERAPQRQRIRQRLAELWNYERTSLPSVRGGRYFFQRNAGQGSQPLLLVAERLDALPRVLLDPNRLAADGTVALAGWRVSGDGKYLAYGLGTAGSDWRRLRVREVDTGRDLPEILQWVKFSDIAWSRDQRGFFYSRYDEPRAGHEHVAINVFQKLYYHRLGEPQSADRLVYERPDHKDWAFDGEVTDDGRYLVIRVWRGADRNHQVCVQDLLTAGAPVVELRTGFDAQYRLVGNDGHTLWFHTDRDAPRGRIVALDVPAADQGRGDAALRTVVAETSEVMQDANVVGEQFIVRYLRDAAAQVRVFDLSGERRYELKFAGPGTVDGFAGRRGDGETFYAYSSFTTPPTIYRFDTRTGESTTFHAPHVGFQASDFESKQVFCVSRDGTRVPLTIIARRGLERDGDQPTLLLGYGGFNVSLTPAFSVTNIVWLEMGGVLAVANLRGGGEYGREWHDAGRRERKQNVFDDFIGAAEWLVGNRYTNPRRLAISGRSNGGLLVGAAMTQRPELFAAALPGVGVLDMLRYQQFTIGWAWIPEYGSSEDPDDFRTLFAYSPLHNLKPGGRYPATLITTADHDDRVVPAHSFKFGAALQAAQSGPQPILIRIDTRTGHGSGVPAPKLIEASTDTLTFLSTTLRIEP